MTTPSGKAHKTESLNPTGFTPPEASSGTKLPIKLISISIPAAIAVFCLIYFVVFSSSLEVRINAEAGIDVETEIEIEGRPHIAIGGRYLLLPGDIQISASAEGYQMRMLEVEVLSGQSSLIELELEPLPGDLRILVEPNIPVQVALDGVDQGTLTTPLLPGLPVGSYEIYLDAWLYEPWTQQVDIIGKGTTQELSIELVPNWADINLVTNPAGANVYIDEQLIGSTPLSFQSEAGESELKISLSGYRDYVEDLNLSVGEQIDKETILDPLESTLILSSSPLAATVTVNGNYLGETPLDIELSPNQPHQISLFKAGYLSQTEQLTMQHLEQREVHRNLQPDLAEVSISVYPEDAEVLVDGQLIGSGSQNLQLMTKIQNIVIRGDGYESQVSEILPTRNIAQHLNFRLLTIEESEWAAIPARYQTSQGHEFVLFRDAGVVELGSERQERERRANETRWSAELERAFYISAHQVTNAQYKVFNQDHSSGNHLGNSLDGPNQPVVNLSWQQAALYCNWLSAQEGLEPFYQTTRGFVSGVNEESTGYRLMTEAEWSWSARTMASGLTQKYSWGNDEMPTNVENVAGAETEGIINFYLENIEDEHLVSAPVGSYGLNHRGLADIAGNAAEWIHDWYAAQPYPEDQTQANPLGPDIGEFHVIRGASWARGYLPQLRLAYRDSSATGRNDVGFRVARYAK